MFKEPVRSSSFEPGWAVLPQPEPLILVHRDGSDPAKPGEYEISMSLVDKDGRVGPISTPVLFTATMPNWSLRIRWHGIDRLTPATGIILWHRRVDSGVDDAQWFDLGPYNGNKDETVKPFLPLTGWDSHLTRSVNIKRADRRYPQMNWPPYSDPYWVKTEDVSPPIGESVSVTGNLPAPAPPTVELLHVPNVAMQVAFSWVGNDGESLPSVPTDVPPMAGFPAENSSPLLVSRQSVCPPNGALGMHVYLIIDGEWHLQPAPHVTVQDMESWLPDQLLWPLSCQKFVIDRVVETSIPPVSTAGRSWLSRINRAVYETNVSVIIDTDDPICCPIISPHKRTIEGIGDVFFDHRTIAGELQQRWDIVPSEVAPDGVTGYAMGWPMWLETAQRTRLVGAYFWQKYTGGVKDGVGIDMLSYLGSSCFHFRPERCFFAMEGDGHTVGIRSLQEAGSVDGHQPSEPIWIDTEVAAAFPIVVEGQQSANWQFHNTTAISVGDTSEHCVITQNNSGNLAFSGRITTDGGRALAAIMSARQLKLAEWFSDQGHSTWVVLGSYGKTRVEIQCAGTNHQGQNKSFLHLVEAPRVGNNQNEVVISGNSGNFGWQVPPPGDWWITHTDIEVSIFSPRYCGVRFNVAPMPLLATLTFPTPTYTEWENIEYTNAYGTKKYVTEWDGDVDQATVTNAPKVLGFSDGSSSTV